MYSIYNRTNLESYRFLFPDCLDALFWVAIRAYCFDLHFGHQITLDHFVIKLKIEEKAKLSRYEDKKEVVVEINRSESPLEYLEVDTSIHLEGENHLKDTFLSISCQSFPHFIKEDHKLNHYYNTYPGYILRANNPLAKKQPTSVFTIV